ncbi:hypothetical protein COY14_03450 [Candidatus Roizmanbacteria bacterium CG_4_10_14_0_2_um_filter_36_9]|uniref:Aminoglycoside phosphotransferase domain-containing protein n=2 Tax=Candidatus Roizmaniibacteriota TaxID=1752723 RepID=A0A2M7U3B9_9BACT|nr:MAG: hypothetical protein COY14_03450 [Candidatus Roizmanbacteria bacterium CG_4_10_14_0_2_um_filter_36_9]
MNKNIYILPISATFRNIKYPERIIKSVEGLERRIKGKKLKIKIGKSLSGGTVSSVYEATLDGKKAVVKHTENTEPKTPVDFLIMSDAHDVEVKIINKLETIEGVRVPKIIENFPKFTTMILEDLRVEGYTLLSDQIIGKKLSLKSAENIGKSLAILAKQSQIWDEFKTNESAQMSFYERGLEYLIAYPNDTKKYYKMEAAFTQYKEEKEEQQKLDKYFVWPDGHPKNMLVTDNGEVAFIDFGRCHWGDQRYMLPNFLAHIFLYGLLGYIPEKKTIDYVKRCVKAYGDIIPVKDEGVFAEYVGLEVFHRAFGRYVDGVENRDGKLKLLEFAMIIFDKEIKSIKSLLHAYSSIK